VSQIFSKSLQAGTIPELSLHGLKDLQQHITPATPPEIVKSINNLLVFASKLRCINKAVDETLKRRHGNVEAGDGSLLRFRGTAFITFIPSSLDNPIVTKTLKAVRPVGKNSDVDLRKHKQTTQLWDRETDRCDFSLPQHRTTARLIV